VIVHDGTWHSEDCDIDYKNGIPGMELEIFQQLFDSDNIKKYEPLAFTPSSRDSRTLMKTSLSSTGSIPASAITTSASTSPAK